MTRRAHPEEDLQCDVIRHLRTRGKPGLMFWHTPNGAYLGKNGSRQGGRLKAAGVLAGVSDIVALYQGRFYALELKTETGRPTEAQMAFISSVNAAGGFGSITCGVDQAIRILEVWGLLLGKADLRSAV